jgi:hypothetical protein
MWQPTVDPLGTFVIDTKAAVIGLSSLNVSCGGGGGGGGGGAYSGTYSLVAGGCTPVEPRAPEAAVQRFVGREPTDLP